VIERDPGDRGRDRGLDDVRRVQPAAHPHLEYGAVHTRLPKRDQGSHEGKLEERQVEIQGTLEGVREEIVAGRLLVDAYPLRESVEVRGREESHPIARTFQSQRRDRGNASLAVGPGDVENSPRPFGMTKRVYGLTYAVEPELDASGSARIHAGENVR
jgi:hypothetical protein